MNEDIKTIAVNENENLDVVKVDENENIKNIALKMLLKGEPGKDGTSNYEEAENKPSINGVELLGNKTTSELLIKFAELPDNPYTLIDEDFILNNGGTVTNARKMIYATDLLELDNCAYIVDVDKVRVNITGSGVSGYDVTRGGLIQVDSENYQLSLTTSEGNSYFGDYGDGVLGGDYYASLTDVQAMIESSLPPINKLGTANITIDNLDNGIYVLTGSRGHTLKVNVNGTVTSYRGVKKNTLLIKDDSDNVTIIGNKHLIFTYDSTNAYYNKPVDLQTLNTKLADIESRLTALGG